MSYHKTKVPLPPEAKQLPDQGGWVNRFEIKSQSSDRTYIVAQRSCDGSWGCSCPAWTRNKARTCKHVAMITLWVAALGE